MNGYKNTFLLLLYARRRISINVLNRQYEKERKVNEMVKRITEHQKVTA
jgi:hypothetical protein